MIETIHGLVWGPGLLLFMLLTGIGYTIRSRLFQVRGISVWWNSTIGKAERGREKQGITGFQSACTALAATIGTGNIVGVAAALKAGGPGAIFWMWISALLGMMTGYAEVWLGIRYRYKNAEGRWIGGAVTYLARGLSCPALGIFYGMCCLLASFGMGGMVQSNAAVQTLNYSFGVPTILGALFVGLLTFGVLAGGTKRIVKLTEAMIPWASAIYVVCSLVVLLVCCRRVPLVFAEIFRYALIPRAALGGVGGYGICRAFQYGIARGVFSNEAGLGSLAGLHGEAEYTNEAEQGMWAIFEVGFDTIVICTMTAMVILCVLGGAEGLERNSLDGAALAAWSFQRICGNAGSVLIAGAMLVFSFATMIAWFYLGRQTLEAVLELMFSGGTSEGRSRRKTLAGRMRMMYLIGYIVCVILGGIGSLELVWKLSDIWNGLMAFPNLLALFWLRRQVCFPQNGRTGHGEP